MRRTYWNFYWPLGVTDISLVLANQFQNGVLARYEDGTVELAIFAYAFSTFSVFRAALVFVPQMGNLLARTRRSHRVLSLFLLVVGVGLSAPLLVLGATSYGASLVAATFELEGAGLAAATAYLRWLAPLIAVHAFRQYLMGLLIQMRSTRLVTALNFLYLGTVLLVLVVGYRLGGGPVVTLVGAQWAGALVHLVLLGVLLRRIYQVPDVPSEELTYGAALGFFWPVAITSMMFALSRPILYAFVSGGPNAVVEVAALRLAFDLAIFFHQPLNQFRNLFATFGTSRLADLRRFQIEIVVALAAAMALVSASHIDRWFLTTFVGVHGDVLAYAEESFRVMCALPLVVGYRNYFHGIALARKTTRSMAVGALLRVAAIAFGASVFSGLGLLDHRVAAGLLVLGFLAEAVVVRLALRAATGS